MSKTLTDFIGHQLLGQGYHPYLPSRAVLATVVGVTRDGDELIVRIDEDELDTEGDALVALAPLWDEDLDFGSTPILGEDPDSGFELQLDFWK